MRGRVTGPRVRRLVLAGLALARLGTFLGPSARAQDAASPPGVLAQVTSPADLTDLLAALNRARNWSVKGQAEISVYFPPRSVPTRTAGRLPVLPVRPALLARTFTVTRQEGGTLAGRATDRYDLTPRTGQAARWTVWIDRAWKVPLAFEERMPDGTLARRAALLRVQGPPVRLTSTPPAPVPPGLQAALLSALPGVRLPAGFSAVAIRTRPQEGGLELTLTDGLNVLALVIGPRGVRAAPGVASVRVTAADGPRFVWLVGNLPDAVLSRALSGVRTFEAGALGTVLAAADSNR